MQAYLRLSLLLLCAALGLAKGVQAHPEYRVTIMAPANSFATDINSAGVVIGNYPRNGTATRAFLNRGSALVDLGEGRGVSSNAVAINDKGQVIGHWMNETFDTFAFLYQCGRRTDLPPNPGWLTTYTDINNHGYMTAYGVIRDLFEAPHGFLRSPDGRFRDIGALPLENPMTIPHALNNRNQIVGGSSPFTFPDQPWRAFIWTRGVMRDMGDFGTEPNVGLAINDHGKATGYASLLGGFRDQHAFLYSHGRLIDIDTSQEPFERFSAGMGINNHGHIVGFSMQLSGFIYRGRRMQSLNALIDPRQGWDIRFPEAINDAGQIAATGYRNQVQYAVRLDLIRPHVIPAPQFEGEDALALTAVAPQHHACAGGR